MSAFLVGETTIHKILTEFDANITVSDWRKKKYENALGIDFGHPDWKSKLGQKMWDLNQLSLKHRYGDEKKELVYKYEPFTCTKIQAFKALQCWLYQCTEGDIPENSWLYKFFDETIIREWAESLVMKTPQYDVAEWG
jgi:hypothetical protein